MRRLVALAALLALAGCGRSEAGIAQGGRVVGDAVTIYSSLPDPGRGTARDMVDAEKLALLETGGRAAERGVNFASVDEGDTPKEAARSVEGIVRDPQAMAVIGSVRSSTAMTAVPLLNAAGILHVSPGAGYPGFSAPIAPGEPARWFPSGRRTFARLVADDRVQAQAMLDAAGTRRVRLEQEPGRAAAAFAAAIREQGDVTDRAPVTLYAGQDPRRALDFLARTDGRIVLPDALARAGIAGRLSPAERRRTTLVTSAPERDPGFEAAFREHFGRAPSPYALVGYDAMQRVLGAIERAGAAAGSRSRVIDAFFVVPPQPPPFRAVRP